MLPLRRPRVRSLAEARDFILCCCVASGLAYSGDKEGMLRVWSARSGELLARVSWTAGSVSSLAASRGRLLLGDSLGHIYSLSCAALLRGAAEGLCWRAHDGKVSALHARTYDGNFISGGADGAVRRWSDAKIARQAGHFPNGAQTAAAACPSTAATAPCAVNQGGSRQSQVDAAAGGTAAAAAGSPAALGACCVDLGLWAVAECDAIARHSDTVTLALSNCPAPA